MKKLIAIVLILLFITGVTGAEWDYTEMDDNNAYVALYFEQGHSYTSYADRFVSGDLDDEDTKNIRGFHISGRISDDVTHGHADYIYISVLIQKDSPPHSWTSITDRNYRVYAWDLGEDKTFYYELPESIDNALGVQLKINSSPYSGDFWREAFITEVEYVDETTEAVDDPAFTHGEY